MAKSERVVGMHNCTIEDHEAIYSGDEDTGDSLFWLPRYQCLDVDDPINLWGAVYNTSTLQIRVDPCKGPDCYEGEELLKRKSRYKVDFAWTHQEFDKDEYHGSTIKKTTTYTISPTLAYQRQYEVELRQDEATRHD